MKTIVDFHIHSKYSRATSKHLDLLELAKWSKIKGLDVVSCGDFTHPRWLSEIESKLSDDGSGLLTLEGEDKMRFILGTEVACIYRHRDSTRRLHHILLAPSIQAVKKINDSLTKRGCKLASDGRPILGMSSKELLQILLDVDSRCMLIPAHIWTPWFAIFGSKSGYDLLEDCFEDLSSHIVALETGLSSDPEMNWAWSKLDRYALVSNSDAHSGPKIGREANVFDLPERSYDAILSALMHKDPKQFLHTLEFFPEEGKYHFDGHNACGVSWDPVMTKKQKGICPQCKKPITVGVLHRVDNLRDRAFGERPLESIPFKKIVPLPEIIADYFDVAQTSKKVLVTYLSIIEKCGTEFDILLTVPREHLIKYMNDDLADAILRMRDGRVIVEPGYDGKYGIVSLFSKKARAIKKQESLW